MLLPQSESNKLRIDLGCDVREGCDFHIILRQIERIRIKSIELLIRCLLILFARRVIKRQKSQVDDDQDEDDDGADRAEISVVGV